MCYNIDTKLVTVNTKNMKKKILSLLGCLVPLGAWGYTVTPDVTVNLSPGANGAVGGQNGGGNITGLDIAANSETMTILNGGGLIVGSDAAGNSGGITIGGNVFIGMNTGAAVNGDLVALPDINKNGFTVSSDGAISVGGNLNLASGYELIIQTTNDDRTIDMTVGGTTRIDGQLKSGYRDADGNKYASINSLTLGDVGVGDSGVADLVVNSVTFGMISTGDGAVLKLDSVAGDIVTRGINAKNSDIDIIALGDFSIMAGGLANIATQGNVGTTNISATNIISNAAFLNGRGGTLVLNADENLQIGNGLANVFLDDLATDTAAFEYAFGTGVVADDIQDYALVTNGDVYIDVGGSVNIASIYIGDATNVLDIKAGYLSFTDVNAWNTLFNNNLDTLSLNLTSDDILYSGVISNGNTNTNASMTLNANRIQVSGINNSGVFTVTAANYDVIGGDVITNNGATTKIVAQNGIEISENVTGAATSSTEIRAGDDLVISKDIKNDGQMSLAGNIQAMGNVTNAGTFDARGSSIYIGNTLINNGALNLVADGAAGKVTVGEFTANTGIVNIASFGGTVSVTNGLTIKDGAAANFAQQDGDASVSNFTNLTVGGDIDIAGNLTISDIAATGSGNVNINTTGAVVVFGGDNINIAGNLMASDTVADRVATLDVANISVGNVVASGRGALTLGGVNGAQIIAKDIQATDGGIITLNGAGDSKIGSLTETDAKIIADGVFAATGDINVTNGVWGTDNVAGLIVNDNLSITGANDVNIDGGVHLGDGRSFMVSGKTALINGIIDNAGTLNISSNTTAQFNNDITNSGDLTLLSGTSLNAGIVKNNAGTMNLFGGDISIDSIEIDGGTLTVGRSSMASDISLHVGDLTLLNDSSASVWASNITIDTVLDVTGNMAQGVTTCTNGLCINGDGINDIALSVAKLIVSAGFDADSLTGTYDITSEFSIVGSVSLTDAASVKFISPMASVGSIDNNGTLTFVGDTLTAAGDVLIDGDGVIKTSGNLYQNAAADSLIAGDMNLVGGTYEINADRIEIGGDINGADLQFFAQDYSTGMDITAGGSVMPGADFWGLAHLNVGGNYTVNSDSRMQLLATPGQDFWADVMALGGAFAVVNNAQSAAVTVGGNFVLPDNITDMNDFLTITLFDMVDSSRAIWFMNVAGRVESGESTLDEIIESFGELRVQFCNADRTICMDFLPEDHPNNGLDKDPREPMLAWLGINDYDPHNIYILFNSTLESRAEIFKIRPIVETVPGTADVVIGAAGALDDLIEARANETKFFNKKPLQLIPLIFQDTPLSQMADQLFDRMNHYDVTEDAVLKDAAAASLANFSRLYVPREIEQLAMQISLNEHTNFRTFEDRIIDEFIWNRNRKLKKAWSDVEFGFATLRAADDNKTNANRISISGGFDWQSTDTLILGITGRVSHTAGDVADNINLGYGETPDVAGHMSADVTDTNIGLGAYALKTLNEEMRVYGNAFLDLHVLNVTRNQNFIDTIDGNGTAFAFTGEIGLLHDWLYQYVVGNAYVRVGYNTGFSLTQQVNGYDYMDLESDGYAILTPGYSLTAQKRVYTSPWFQFRPYATVGVEYDVLGAPDSLEYKFSAANNYTEYDMDVNPLWANIGGGVEFLSATGVHFGIDYRYQYNNQIQLHNIRASGMYRF